MDRIELEIREERVRQEIRFGKQNHDPFKWMSILGEEVGEVNKAANDAYKWDDKTFGGDRRAALKPMREELIQVAAVAKAFIECIDRNEWK